MTSRVNLPALSFSLLVFSGASLAEPRLEEVLVSGELHQTKQLELSNSVTVIDQQLIKARNAQNLEDLLNLAPNVNYATGASRGRFLQIRGIGERSQYQFPINPSVGVIVDGIDFTGLATGVALLDASQVEVFRGPQGTLYGANALAGMINVVGAAPTDSLSGEVSIGGGNYNSVDVSGVISAPVTDSLGWRLAAQKNVSDGYIENAFLGREDTNNIEETSVRNQFRWQAGDDLQLDLVSYWIDVDNGYDAFSLDNNRTTLSDQPGHDRQESQAHVVNGFYEGAQAADIKISLSYIDSATEYGYDEDWAYREICPINSDCAYWQYSSTDNYVRDKRNITLDARALSKPGAEIAWALGLYRREEKEDLQRIRIDNDPEENFYAPIGTIAIERYDYTNDVSTTALYGQVDVPLSNNLMFVTGLRGEHHQAEFSDSQGVDDDPDEFLWGGKLALEYRTAADTLVYGLLSRGYKAGGFNPDPSLNEHEKPFYTETMLNLELGVKGLWLDNRLQVQVAAFYQQRDDVQVKKSYAKAVNDFIEYIGNAAAGNNYGVETEVQFAATDALSLFASVGLLGTEYVKFNNSIHVDAIDGIYDLSGREQAHAPSYQYFAGLQYSLLSNLYWRLEFEGKDSFYFSSSHEERSESVGLVNTRLNYDFGNTSLAVWGKNLTDETVETRGFYFSNDYGNDPRKLYAAESYTQKGAPLTWGISVTQRF